MPTSKSLDPEIDRLAATQFGIISRSQALVILGRWGLEVGRRRRLLVPAQAGAFRCAGAPATFRQRALGACLACGPPVAVSHISAARLWAFEAVAPVAGCPIEVSVPRARTLRRGDVQIHRARLLDGDIVEREGIPVTSIVRTLLDISAFVSVPVLARCFDDALRRNQTTVAAVRARIDDRRPGGRTLRELAEARGAAGVGDSAGADIVLAWIAAAELPLPVREHPVLAGGRVRFLDMAYPELQVAIEYHGWEFHQMRSRMDDDHVRTSELELLGWVVLVVTAAHSEAETVDRIWRARALQRRRLGRDG